jgi:hypothetical protein
MMALAGSLTTIAALYVIAMVYVAKALNSDHR